MAHQARDQNPIRTMAGDRAEPRDESDFESTLAHDARETRVLQLRLLEFLTACRAAVSEGAVV